MIRGDKKERIKDLNENRLPKPHNQEEEMIIDRDVKNRLLAQRAMSLKDRETDLRDYFAGQALAGMISGASGLAITEKEFAEQSYKLADAMLEARKK